MQSDGKTPGRCQKTWLFWSTMGWQWNLFFFAGWTFFAGCGKLMSLKRYFWQSQKYMAKIYGKAKKPMSIADRFEGIGLMVVRESGNFERMCNRCVSVVLNQPIAHQGEQPAWWLALVRVDRKQEEKYGSSPAPAAQRIQIAGRTCSSSRCTVQQ